MTSASSLTSAINRLRHQLAMINAKLAGKGETRVRTKTSSLDELKPPYKVGKQWPYENDHRAKKTNPHLVEMIPDTDPRSRRFVGATGGRANRAELRARGYRGPSGNPGHQPRNPIPRSVRRAALRLAEKDGVLQ